MYKRHDLEKSGCSPTTFGSIEEIMKDIVLFTKSVMGTLGTMPRGCEFKR